MGANTLPIHDVLPRLLAALDEPGSAVLIAPPGAGKTTAVAPALIDRPWCDGQVVITSPRRVAARAAAERMAEQLGERAGETVGYLTRLDSRQSARTRILVVTEAILVNRLLEDPELPGVSALLFDEAHERHLDSDLGLALALESQSILRPDLRICVMSATIDGHRFARLLGPAAPVVESAGRSWPLRVEWFGARPELRTEDAVSQAVLAAWSAEDGDLLAFLPGVREIERVKDRLEARLPGVPVLPLHGQVRPQQQREAIRRDSSGRRRIVLATAIAETSLTLDGVSVVVDSGLSRRAVFDRAAGATHLVTRASSQATAEQRAGRAARQGPGVAYRLWNEAAHGGRHPYDPPEIETADLTDLVLSLARWGTDDPASLRWLDLPPAPSIAAARRALTTMGALDQSNRITEWGKAIARLPLAPADAAALLSGAQGNAAGEVAQILLLAQERGLGGQGEDLSVRLRRWNRDDGARAQASRKLASRWADMAKRGLPADTPRLPRTNAAIAIALANPDRIARKRSRVGEHWLAASGRGYILDPATQLAQSNWIVVMDAQGQAGGARITAGLTLPDDAIDGALASLVETRKAVRWNDSAMRVEARRERHLGAIRVSTGPDPEPDGEAMASLLLEQAVSMLADLLPDGMIARLERAGLADKVLAQPKWLTPLLEGRRDLDLDAASFGQALLNFLSWEDRQALESRAPTQFVSPAGTRHAIDYGGDDAPCVEVRAQALFGLDDHPLVGDSPLLLKLTSPAGRPIQATRDLPGFWRGSWKDVRKDMKGRYPKHRWPEEPWTEKPSLKTKNAFSKTSG